MQLDATVMEAKVGIPADVDHIAYASDNNKNETINKLKNMIILHLEVIKEQADKLMNKDKLIAKLKQENDELRQRLEAVVVVPATPVKGRGRTPRKTPNAVVAANAALTTPAKVTTHDTGNKKLTPGKRRSKKTPADEFDVVGGGGGGESTTPKQARLDIVNGVRPAGVTAAAESSGGEETATKSNMVFLMSEKPYMSCEWKKTFAEIDVEREAELRATLEIPTWVERDLVPLYTKDGTEDTSDEVYMKRHQKHETHEKRRKRWDVQRLREVRTVEKLRQRYMKEELQEEKLKIKPLMSSFYPPVEALKHIHVVDQLPVLAFGEPIPQLPQQDFYLPWQKNPDTTMSPSTSFTKTRFFKKN